MSQRSCGVSSLLYVVCCSRLNSCAWLYTIVERSLVRGSVLWARWDDESLKVIVAGVMSAAFRERVAHVLTRHCHIFSKIRIIERGQKCQLSGYYKGSIVSLYVSTLPLFRVCTQRFQCIRTFLPPKPIFPRSEPSFTKLGDYPSESLSDYVLFC
jgi:hypothetical protein